MTNTIEERAEAATGHYNYHKIPKWAWEDGYKLGYKEGYDAGKDRGYATKYNEATEREMRRETVFYATWLVFIGLILTGLVLWGVPK